MFKKKTDIDWEAHFREIPEEDHPMAPGDWDDGENDPIQPRELRRRLSTLDSRIEGINHHTKLASQYLGFVAIVAGLFAAKYLLLLF